MSRRVFELWGRGDRSWRDQEVCPWLTMKGVAEMRNRNLLLMERIDGGEIEILYHSQSLSKEKLCMDGMG